MGAAMTLASGGQTWVVYLSVRSLANTSVEGGTKGPLD